MIPKEAVQDTRGSKQRKITQHFWAFQIPKLYAIFMDKQCQKETFCNVEVGIHNNSPKREGSHRQTQAKKASKKQTTISCCTQRRQSPKKAPQIDFSFAQMDAFLSFHLNVQKLFGDPLSNKTAEWMDLLIPPLGCRAKTFLWVSPWVAKRPVIFILQKEGPPNGRESEPLTQMIILALLDGVEGIFLTPNPQSSKVTKAQAEFSGKWFTVRKYQKLVGHSQFSRLHSYHTQRSVVVGNHNSGEQCVNVTRLINGPWTLYLSSTTYNPHRIHQYPYCPNMAMIYPLCHLGYAQVPLHLLVPGVHMLKFSQEAAGPGKGRNIVQYSKGTKGVFNLSKILF